MQEHKTEFKNTIKVKKLNKNLRSSNIPTIQSEKYVNQLFAFEAVYNPYLNLEVGYCEEEIGNGIRSVHFVCTRIVTGYI